MMAARSLISGVKIMSSVSDGFFNALIRRGYTAEAAASQSMVSSDAAVEEVSGGSSSGGIMKKEVEEKSTNKEAWVPDPLTGYYRPENYIDEIDAVDLRAMFLKRGKKPTN